MAHAVKVTEAHKSALSKAKIALMARKSSAFFTTLCFSMKFVWDDTIPTACTDGLEIRINPDFFMALSVEERVFVLVHETMHPAYQHMLRIQELKWDPRKGNIAGDHVINLQLKARGFAVPDWVLKDPQYEGMGMERIYKLLPDPPQGGGGGGLMDDIVFGDKLTPEQTKKLTRQIEDILVRAQMQSKISKDKPGTIPGEIEVFLDRLLNPKLPWHVILRRWFQDNFAKTDYSWKRPNRRFFPQHHLPSLWSEALMDIACFCDISGSVTDPMFNRYIAETHSVMKSVKPQKLYLGCFDTEVKGVDVIRDARELKSVKFHGRGGTRIQPVLDWLNEHKPKGALIFSDGGFSFEADAQCSVPIVWVVHDNPNWTAPMGKVIYFEME